MRNDQGRKTQLNTAGMTRIALMTAILCVISPWVIVVPISPVPISLALFAVLLAAYLLGARDGSICCILYLILGCVGLPVFSGGVGGPAKLFGPTGGYLLGYIFAVWITGFFVEKWKTQKLFHVLGMIFGISGCYLLGTLWLSVSMTLGFRESLMMGVVPYIPGDVIKLFLAGVLGVQLRQRMRKGL